jgi:hypothetical protein
MANNARRRARRSIAMIAFIVAQVTCCVSSVAAELIMFETPGCPWCARWLKEVGPGYSKSVEGQRAPLHRADQSTASGMTIKFAAPIVASPTFVLVNEGREIGRITGYPGPDFFWGLLAELIVKLDRGAMRKETTQPLPIRPIQLAINRRGDFICSTRLGVDRAATTC